ncbi:preprotein translocase subunit SecG [Alkalibacter saccharofermentans]|uniref:Protein-export membrane protein SecG n=1 Tax=Alkalibacter saccharofermentans DSM 14828 TaxID=1120975 RepID=A0A1M4V087_9FIRM|nr:preprotein translocase subunit SecG [Alkalibacter saccharofermentans]SHE62401.1 preprotein translocase subunit SecG [Alkalibacter saccharofermentans DSM 14828]
MDKLLIALLILSSIVLIASILLQPGKSAGLSGSIAGGAESLFGKKKAKGYEAMLEKATTISAVIFMLSAFLFSII